MEPMQWTLDSRPRLKLWAMIKLSGYQTARDFCRAAQIEEASAMLVLRGQLVPSTNFIKKTAAACRTGRKKVVEALY
jgi:hypothetical protein